MKRRTAPPPRMQDAFAAAMREVPRSFEVVHRHERPPCPVRVYAEVFNGQGELWRVQPVTLLPDQRHVRLNDFPISWLTGNRDDVVLGQAGIGLVLEY